MESKIFKWTRNIGDYCERMAWKCKLKCPCLLLLAVKALMVNGKWEEKQGMNFNEEVIFHLLKLLLRDYHSSIDLDLNVQLTWHGVRLFGNPSEQ